MRSVAMQVVAGLIYQGDRLLVCQRREGGPFPLKWEFPGGKVEGGEECLPALRRELTEELGIEVQTATRVCDYKHLYSNGTEVDLIFFRVDQYREPIANRVFREILWVEIPQLKELDFLEGDLPLIEKLMRQELIP